MGAKADKPKPKEVIFRSFGHVVSPENIYLNFVDSFEGSELKFTYEN